MWGAQSYSEMRCSAGSGSSHLADNARKVGGSVLARKVFVDRPRMVALNKVDVPDAAELAALVTDELKARGLPVFAVSTKTRDGLAPLTFAMAELVAKRRAEAPAPAPKRIVIRPTPVAGGPEFTIVRQGDGEGGQVWRVRGDKPERWVKQTDFNNP